MGNVKFQDYMQLMEYFHLGHVNLNEFSTAMF